MLAFSEGNLVNLSFWIELHLFFEVGNHDIIPKGHVKKNKGEKGSKKYDQFHTGYNVANICNQNVQIYNAQQGDFYNLLDIDTLGIGIYGPYERISDEWQGYLSELPDNHTLDIEIYGPYVKIADVWQGHLSGLLDVHTLDIGMFGPNV